jgi:hypothetical protein
MSYVLASYSVSVLTLALYALYLRLERKALLERNK